MDVKAIGNNGNYGKAKPQSGFLKRAAYKALIPLSLAGGMSACSKGEGPIPDVDPPAKKLTLNDEFMNMMKNVYAVSAEEIAAGKIKGDTLAVLSQGTGTLFAVKKLEQEGDSVVLRISTQDPSTKAIQSVDKWKIYKAAGDAEGTLSGRSYSSPRAIFNDAKMKFSGASKFFTKDNAATLFYEGQNRFRYIVQKLGEQVRAEDLIGSGSSIIKRIK